MADMRAPAVVPIGWKVVDLGAGQGIFQQLYGGLKAIVSVETYEPGDPCPTAGPGEYLHLSLSRAAQYPSWNEMRDYIYRCGMFDPDVDVVMVLPPKGEYVNVHENCFHWWQRRHA